MVLTRNKKQQNKRLFGQLSERDIDFMIGQSNQDEHSESKDDMICRGNSSDNSSNPTQINCPQVDLHTLEENIVKKVRREVDNLMTSVETRIQDAVLTAIENLVIPSVELALKSANAPSERSVDGIVLDPDQRDFLSKIEGLRMTAPSRINSHTDINRIDETRANITVEEGDLLVNEKNIDRQTYAHHSCVRFWNFSSQDRSRFWSCNSQFNIGCDWMIKR